jgi:hypothetical protein
MRDSEMLYRRVMALLAAGQHLNLDRPETLGTLERFHRWYEINIRRQNWDGVVERLALSELILLTQMLTVLEREFQWSGGSVSIVISLMQNLRSREPRIAALLADWVVQRTNNPYLPFGRQGWIISRPQVNLRAARDEAARYSAETCERWEAQRLARLEGERQAKALATEAEEAKALYITGAQAAGQRTSVDLLRYVALDRNHHIEFFPKAWARVSRDDLLQRDPGVRAALAERLGRMRSVTWRRLCKRLKELDSD